MTSPTHQPGDTDRTEPPEFGPAGYLPAKAARRARKIVLRAPLGLQWVVASLVVGVVVLAAGVLLLTRADTPPPPPFVAVGAVEELAGQVTDDQDRGLLIVGVGGRIRALDAPAGIAYCEVSRRLESSTDVWNLAGRALTGQQSLAEHPSTVVDGILYVDPTVTAPAATPAATGVEPACG